MKYLSTTIHIAAASATDVQTAIDLLAALLGDCGYESFEQSPTSLTAYIQASLFDSESLKQAIDCFPMPGVTLEYSTESVDDCDWNNEWEQSGFSPIDVDGLVTIYDARHTDPSTVPTGAGTPLPLFIEASQAFGTGTHQTTQMVLRSLIDAGVEGKTVIDCGCGTGILAITALRMGASRAVAYDIDEWSTANTRHNANLNATEQIEILLGDAQCLEQVEGSFQIIMANINRNILLAELPKIVKKADPMGCTLIVSGFLTADISAIEQAVSHLGFRLIGTQTSDDWTCLSFCLGNTSNENVLK